MADLIEIKVPDIGDFDAVEIIEVLVEVGAIVEENQDIITLESDKAAMEIPSPCAAVIKELKVLIGDKVRQGDVIAIAEAIESTSKKAPELEKTVQKPLPEIADKVQPVAVSNAESMANTSARVLVEIAPFAPDSTAGFKHAHASPSVRQFARELGVTLSSVIGSGMKGRITKEDVQNFVKQKINAPATTGNTGAIPPVPVINFEKFGDVTNIDLSRIKKISGKHLHACWLNIPHVTQFDEADITDLEKFRKENKNEAAKKGVNLTPLVFVMKAVVASLKMFPELNSSLSEDKHI